MRGNLLCKVYRHELSGHTKHKRSGSLYMLRWHQTWATGYQGRHIGGEIDYIIYCIILDGALVYKPFDYPEITARIGETAGTPAGGTLCVL
ncbi:hypothetical protein GCM10011611_40830 [Aliidongia dinghuensis]|uniref:Uncharacterized protein n=2 Tax=Aliidongia dinghuensis TaxID=1867774 RepID=A0A8J2YWF6_9PROT|nr:hypothetical protein GCM10011611_40830 [Aliidongia dinghuensis]